MFCELIPYMLNHSFPDQIATATNDTILPTTYKNYITVLTKKYTISKVIVHKYNTVETSRIS